MNKVLYLQECYFRLPENFNGTCGEALMLLAKRRLEQEKNKAILNESDNDNRIKDFWNNTDARCTMSYSISSEDVLQAKSN